MKVVDWIVPTLDNFMSMCGTINETALAIGGLLEPAMALRKLLLHVVDHYMLLRATPLLVLRAQDWRGRKARARRGQVRWRAMPKKNCRLQIARCKVCSENSNECLTFFHIQTSYTMRTSAPQFCLDWIQVPIKKQTPTSLPGLDLLKPNTSNILISPW